MHLKCRLQIDSIWTNLKFCRLVRCSFLPYSKTHLAKKIFDWSKLEEFADDKLKMARKAEFFLDTRENMGNASY